jgi:hypothetical protein
MDGYLACAVLFRLSKSAITFASSAEGTGIGRESRSSALLADDSIEVSEMTAGASTVGTGVSAALVARFRFLAWGGSAVGCGDGWTWPEMDPEEI